jgi:hypothetical protein
MWLVKTCVWGFFVHGDMCVWGGCSTQNVRGGWCRYSQRDWVLGLVYRLSSGLVKGAGGLCPVDCPGVENVNLTSIITGGEASVFHLEENPLLEFLIHLFTY